MNSFIWRKKNITGGGGSIDSLSGNLNANNHKITSLGSPTDGADAATKNYVDGKLGDFVKIIDNVAINTVNDSGMQEARGWTNNLNNYTYQNQHTYLVVCKITGLQNSTDACATTVIQTNSSSYDNQGQCVIYDNLGTHSMVLTIHLGNTASKQNRIYYHLPTGFNKAGSLALYCWIKDLSRFENS